MTIRERYLIRAAAVAVGLVVCWVLRDLVLSVLVVAAFLAAPFILLDLTVRTIRHAWKG